MIVNIFIIFICTVHLSCQQTTDFVVTQPQYQTVNRDGSASIMCEHNAPVSSILDVRLNRLSQGRLSIICQKGKAHCENVVMYPQYPNKCLFIILNIGPEAMNDTYQCEFTVKMTGGIDITRRGTPTSLRPESPAQSPDFEVTQPQYRTVNGDRSASISCEHNAPVSSILNVRLNRLSQGNSSMLCQKGKNNCENVVMYPQHPNKFLFIILNIGPETADVTYECEFTVKMIDGTDITRRGTPTSLWQESATLPTPSPACPPLPPPPPPQLYQVWILIGLMALFLLYGCVITCVHIRLRVTNQNHRYGPENSTYVEMRKAPLPAK